MTQTQLVSQCGRGFTCLLPCNYLVRFHHAHLDAFLVASSYTSPLVGPLLRSWHSTQTTNMADSCAAAHLCRRPDRSRYLHFKDVIPGYLTGCLTNEHSCQLPCCRLASPRTLRIMMFMKHSSVFLAYSSAPKAEFPLIFQHL